MACVGKFLGSAIKPLWKSQARIDREADELTKMAGIEPSKDQYVTTRLVVENRTSKVSGSTLLVPMPIHAAKAGVDVLRRNRFISRDSNNVGREIGSVTSKSKAVCDVNGANSYARKVIEEGNKKNETIAVAINPTGRKVISWRTKDPVKAQEYLNDAIKFHSNNTDFRTTEWGKPPNYEALQKDEVQLASNLGKRNNITKKRTSPEAEVASGEKQTANKQKSSFFSNFSLGGVLEPITNFLGTLSIF